MRDQDFRITIVRPRQDFGSPDFVCDAAGVDQVRPRQWQLFDLVAIAVISCNDSDIHWPTTTYLLDVARKSRSNTGDTVRTYAESLLTLLQYLAAKNLSIKDLTEDQWGSYCAFLIRGTPSYSTASANLRLTVAANFLAWAQTTSYDPSPFGQRIVENRQNRPYDCLRGGRRPRGEQMTQLRTVKRLPRFINAADFQALSKEASLPYKLQFKWAICTGLRRFEICALKISDLSRASDVLSTGLVQLQISRKGGRLRSIYVPSTLVEETRWYILMDRAQPKPGFDDYVFLNSRGVGMNRQCLTRKFREVADSIGVKATLHHLRHTFAIQVLSHLQRFELEGEPINAIKALQILMGHSSIETTEIYLDAMDMTSDAVAQTLGYLYGASL